MVKYDIAKVKALGKILDNEYRIEILKMCSEKEYNITDIQKKINISYPHVHKHVHLLRDADLIETYEKIDPKGKNLMVKSKYRIMGNFLEEKNK
jgi:predicted transcriptional regulator